MNYMGLNPNDDFTKLLMSYNQPQDEVQTVLNWDGQSPLSQNATPVPIPNMSRRIQEELGALPKNEGGLAGEILAGRFNAQPSYGDYANALVSTLAGKPTTGMAEAQVGQGNNLKLLHTLGELQKSSKTNAGGSTGEMVDRLMADRKARGWKDEDNTFERAAKDYQTMWRQNLTTDSSGLTITAPGATDALTDINRAKKSGAKQGELQTEAQNNLPDVIDQANMAKKYVGEALNSPGLDANFGMQGLIPNRPGSEASTAHSILQQIQGGTFMNAYSQLRGGGQISDKEGDKAQSAVFRMQTAQSADAFRAAAKDYFDVLDLGIARAQNKASGAVYQGAPAPSQAMPQTIQQPIDYKEYFK